MAGNVKNPKMDQWTVVMEAPFNFPVCYFATSLIHYCLFERHNGDHGGSSEPAVAASCEVRTVFFSMDFGVEVE